MPMFGVGVVRESVLDEHPALCPVCEQERGFVRTRDYAVRYQFFVPRRQEKPAREEAHCGVCGYEMDLKHPRLEPLVWKYQGALDEADRALRWVLVGVAMADKVLEPKEIAAIQRTYARLAKRDFYEPAVRNLAQRIVLEERDLPNRVREGGRLLGPAKREKLFSAALEVAAADGAYESSEGERLKVIARALDIRGERLQALMTRHLENQRNINGG